MTENAFSLYFLNKSLKRRHLDLYSEGPNAHGLPSCCPYNFWPWRPLSTFNITSSSTLVTTGTLRASHVSTKAVAGEAAGVAGQAVASIQ